MQGEHALGEDDAEITLIEYGSYNCPYCQAAHEVIARLRDRFGERMRYVFRHRPITGDATAREAAALVEYAGETKGLFWDAHDALMKRGAGIAPQELEALAARLGLPPRAEQVQAWRRAQQRVQEDAESARRHGAASSPTFL